MTAGAQHALDAVRREQLVGRQQRGQPRRIGRIEEPVGEPEHERQGGEMPDLDRARRRQHGRDGECGPANDLYRDEDAPLRDAIG
ncbi:MAG TPA: hypothetical protein VFM66_04470, partial [Agromyces sp.]|nr:hypothetical protein [Agromyces sp.]